MTAIRIVVERVPCPNGLEPLPLPEYATDGASGMDLRAARGGVIYPLTYPGTSTPNRALVPTGIRVEVPHGCEIQIRPRSGLALKKGISVLNTPGTIDSDYRGEIHVILVNLGDEIFRWDRGDRIAQLVLCPVYRFAWHEGSVSQDSQRGVGGFGSTGTA